MKSNLVLSALAAIAFTPFVSHASITATDAQPTTFSNLSEAEVRQAYPPYPPGGRGSYYAWGRGRDGFGYCYEWTYDGYILNGGAPVSNYLCESRSPSYFDWGTGRDGYGYCYQWTPHGVPMNQGAPVTNYNCESRSRSYYAWGRGRDGFTYCYQWTPYGVPMNQGAPVSAHLCR